MRFHRRYPLLQTWNGIPGARERMRARHLAIARLEPSMFYARGSAFLDLLFCDGDGVAGIPGIEVAVEMLQERERTPLIWPAALEPLGGDALPELEAALLPWLESISLARQLNSERMRRFSDAVSNEDFERARKAGFLCAASYVHVLPMAAPYVYAMRFSGSQVAVRDAYGATGAAVLAAHGARVSADLGEPGLNALAAKWFARDIYGGVESRGYDVSIAPADRAADAPIRISLDGAAASMHVVQVATPAPADVMISFDPEDSPPVREFGAVAPEPALRAAPVYAVTAPAGGSSGTILLLVREEFSRAPNADTDEAHALAARLRAEGFDARLVTPSALREDSRADLVHAFGTERAIAEVLARFKARGTPTVLTPYSSPDANENGWGAALVRAIFTNLRDEGSLEEQLGLFERRLLRIDGGAEDSAGAACAAAHAILAQSGAEEARLRDIAGPGAQVLRADGHVGGPAIAPAPIGAMAGTKPFVFVHAPVEWASNLVLLARVTAAAGVPLAVAGPAVDLDAVIAARSIAPDTFVHLGSPGEAQLEALYRSARIYADVSWRSHGAHRVRRAAASGCALLLSRAGGGADFDSPLGHVDGASEASLREGLEQCRQSGAPAVPFAPADAFGAVVAAYAAAQQFSAAT